jgi:hypothetical protein
MRNATVHIALREAKKAGKKQLAVLIDPDKAENALLDHTVRQLGTGGY